MAKFSMSKERFKNQWLRHFAKDVDKRDIEEHVKGQFIWHVFSWEHVKNENLLVGDDARQAFDAADKSEVICYDEYGGEGVKDRLPARYNTAEKIDKWTVEFYVVAKDYSWTYIKTHECDLCGPYFYKITYEKKD